MRVMSLPPDEARFFGLLVELDRGGDREARTALFEKIAATARFRAARPIEGETFRYLSHWYIPAIRELAGIPGFRPDPAWIARQLRPKITPAKAKAALEVLDQLGMVRVAEDGTIQLSDGDFVTPHEVAGLAVHNYHRGMLQRSQDSIDAFSPSDRHPGAVTVRVPASRVSELKSEVTAFLERILDLSAASPDDTEASDGQQVVQVNVQLFPMSTSVQPPEST